MKRGGKAVVRRWRLVLVVLVCGGGLGVGRLDAVQAGSDAEPVTLPARLSFDEALQLFRTRGLDLLIADAAVRGAEGDERAAQAIFNPALNTGIGSVFKYDPSGSAAGPCVGCSRYSYGVGLSDQNALFDTLTGKRGLRTRVAQAALAAARLGRVDAERVVGAQVKAQYIQLIAADEALDFARQVATSMAETLALNRLRYPKVIDAGDLARIERDKLEADQTLEMAVQNRRMMQAQLAFLLGVRGPLPEFDVDRERIEFRVPPALSQADAATLLQIGLDHRPDLQQAQATVDQLEAAVALARRQRIPDVSLNLQYAQTGTGQDAIQPPTLLGGFTVGLPVFYQQQGQIARAEADRDTGRLQREKLSALVTADVEGAFAAYVASRKLVERMQGSLLGAAKRARDITDVQFRAGEATLMDYLDAQRSYVQTNMEYFTDLANYWGAVFQIEQAVGTEVVP